MMMVLWYIFTFGMDFIQIVYIHKIQLRTISLKINLMIDLSIEQNGLYHWRQPAPANDG